MSTRRIVTGHGPDGTSRVVDDESIDPVELSLLPGAQFTVVWASDVPPEYVADGKEPGGTDYFPPPGGIRYDIITLPPEGDASAGEEPDDPEPAMAEAEAKLPGLVKVFDPDDPGFHTTDTIDLIYVAAGRVRLETTAGAPVELAAGATIVQNGTRHAWRNASDTPATLVNVSLGVTR